MSLILTRKMTIETCTGGKQMKKEQMVGTRLPSELVRELAFIEEVEQSDRSTTVRRLLSKAIQQWKLDHYVRLYGDGKLTLARAAGVSLWEMMDYARSRAVVDVVAPTPLVGCRPCPRGCGPC